MSSLSPAAADRLLDLNELLRELVGQGLSLIHI